MSTGMELQVLNVSQHEQFLRKQEERLNKWCLPASNLNADALTRHALHEMSVDDKLQACTPTSIYLALMACAVTGLVPGKLKSLSFLIPFTNAKKIVDDKGNGREIKLTEATFMVGWRGVKLTGFRAGLDMIGDVVKEGDDFDFDKGTNKFLRHKVALKGRGAVIGSYAYCVLPRGGLEIEWLDLDTLGKIEQFAKSKGGGKSPAWDGPFKDQMQRKSALRRLGKQLEMGEDFHRAEMIENGHDDTGSIAGAIDVITNGEASRMLGAASAESAVFGAAPRPAQVQVAAEVSPGPSEGSAPARPTIQNRSSKAPAGSSSQPATTSASTSSAPGSAAAPTGAGSSPSKLDEAKAKVEGKRPPAAPTSQSGSPATPAVGGTQPARSEASPTAGSAGSTPAAQPATPAASSPPSPATAPASTAPVIDTIATESGASSDEHPYDRSEFGDVAREPSPDEAFDVSFGEEEASQPTGRKAWLAKFEIWSAAHPTRDDVLADDRWKEIFRGWTNACHSKAELDEDRGFFLTWARDKFSVGRKADPAKGITALPRDPGGVDMSAIFSERYKQVP